MIDTDALTDVLQSVQLQSSILCRAELSAPWGVRIAKSDGALFHIIRRGGCYLEVEGREQSVALAGGDVVVLPHSHVHTLSDDPSTPKMDLDDLEFTYPDESLKALVIDGGGPKTQTVSGYFHFRSHWRNPLLEALPPLLRVGSDEERVAPWLQATLQFISNEATGGLPGRQAIITRLCDVLFIQAVRAYLLEHPGRKGWLPALADPEIGPALGLMLRAPEKPWTVASLASEVYMSRSAFSARFTDVVGQPPIECLTHWRMHRAAELLDTTRGGLMEIAEQVGYGSEAAFSKAFKRWAGMPPGAYREEVSHGDGAAAVVSRP